MNHLSILILAAGRGERMKSQRPKVLHAVGEQPLLGHVIQTAKKLSPAKLVVLVGHQAEKVQKKFENEDILWAFQKEQKGTAHAVLCALEALPSLLSSPSRSSKDLLFILYGDVPFIRSSTLKKMKSVLNKSRASLVFLTAELENPTGYGRVVRDASGNIEKIVEEKETGPDEKRIREVNTGFYLVRAGDILQPLQSVKKSILKGEYYLTDLVENLIREGKKVVSVSVKDIGEVSGINSRKELARAEQYFQSRINEEWLQRGVTFIDPNTTRIGASVSLSADVILHPGVILSGRTHIGSGTEILPYSVIEESTIGENCKIGPFAHLRPGSVLGDDSHVGNFVELKKTKLGRGSKANHLAYLGDATIGSKVNVGAGTITCNYDGRKKHRTVIGDGCFIGSDTQFVAPVTLGRGAWVGAGTTVTKNVPAQALAVSRVEQKNILGWAKRRK